MSLVFLAQQEPHELRVGHLLVVRRLPLPARDATPEYSVYDANGERVIVVPRQIVLVYEQVVIAVQLPKLAVDHVEVLVAEVLGDLVDVVLLLQQLDHAQQVRPPQLRNRYPAGPGTVDAVEYPGDDGVDVARVELGRLLQEGEAGVGLHHVLDEGDEVFRAQAVAPASGQDVDEPGGGVVTCARHSGEDEV